VGRIQITAGNLYQNSHQLASSLLEFGIKRNDRVLIALAPGIEFLNIIYANMMLRTLVAIIDPEMGRENYAAKLKQFNPHYIFIDGRLLFLSEHPYIEKIALKIRRNLPSYKFVEGSKLIATGLRLSLKQNHIHLKDLKKSGYPLSEQELANENEEFLVTYTSGTLAEPKAVVHTFGSLAVSIQHLTNLLKTNTDQLVVTHLPHFMLLGINAGLQVFLWNNEKSARQKLAFIKKHGITTLFGPPADFTSLFHLLRANNHQLPACVKNIYLGSAPVYASFLQKIIPFAGSSRITCLYGMTENLMVSFQDGHDKATRCGKGDLVGQPFAGVSFTLSHDNEVCVESNQMFSRYFDDNPHLGKYKTGDLGQLDEQGNLWLTGRKKEMIIRGNFNIYPGLYEPTINKISGINEVAMIGVYDDVKNDEEVYLVVDSSFYLTEKEIYKQLLAGPFSIDKEVLPDKIIFMKLPRSGRQQKVNRRILQQQLQMKK
jgi:acyl-CoA synthetase (AMP-forming)/AMP-acid ligase II